MIVSGKKLKELELVLSRDNQLMVTEAIKTLRNEMPFKGAIGLLVSYYDRSNDNTIRKLICEFMNDLKDKSAIEEVMAGIRKKTRPETKRMLISSCWQSGLDYSSYSTEFVMVFLDEDYMTAIECFTVIESSVNKIPRGKKDELVKIIRQKPSEELKEKQGLTAELISVLT